jgi:hypothetical protein
VTTPKNEKMTLKIFFGKGIGRSLDDYDRVEQWDNEGFLIASRLYVG